MSVTLIVSNLNYTLTGSYRFLEKFNGAFLVLVTAALVVMQPAELLQDLGVMRISFQHTVIGRLGIVILKRTH